MKTSTFVTPLSRMLVSSVFITAGLNKLIQPRQTAQYMASKKMPMVPATLGAAAAIELGAGASLLVGYRHRASATLLAGFLVPASLIFHDFWNEKDAQSRQMQTVNFLKNLAIIGGLLGIAVRGAEEVSLDARRPKPASAPVAPAANEFLRQAAG